MGIDYALFIVTRHRRGLQSGLTPEEAAVKAIDTSGRAVLFAGSTVCIALLGILVLGVSFLNGLAVASALTVVFTVLAAVTLLPALLGVFGIRVLSRRQRRRLGARGVVSPGVWSRWAGTVQRRPAVLAIAATAVMLVLAIPLLSVRLGSSDEGNDPASSTTRQAYDLLADGFGPGFNGPLILVAQTGGPADVAALKTLENQLPHVADVTKVTPLASAHGIEVIQVIPGTSPEAKATSDLIATLHNDTIPAAEHGTTLRVYIGGITATYADFATVVAGKMPWFLLAIIGLSFLLLVAGVPQPAHPGDRGGDEPARRGGHVRRADRVLRVGLGDRRVRPGQGRAARGVLAGGHAGHLVRPVHGLPGLPGQPDERGMGAHAPQRGSRPHRAGGNGPGHHRGGDNHDLRVPDVLLHGPARRGRVRHRAGRRGRAGRVHPAHRAGSRGDAHLRRRQLVAARLAGPAPPAPGHRAPAGNPNPNPTRPSPRSPDRYETIRSVLGSSARTPAVTILTPARPPGRAGRDQRAFLLQRAQPAMNGLIDGSLSTLAPIFAVAFATHQPHYAFLAGLATALGAGVSMAFSEGLSDTGDLTGRGNPFLRGKITGAGTFLGGILHTLPFLIPAYRAALAAALATIVFELVALAWIRWRFFATGFLRSFISIAIGGAIIASVSAALGAVS